jgi:putative transcriptional regulator
MKAEMFAELLESVKQALEYEQGKRTLKTTVITRIATPMAARDVRRVRETLQASQAVFANYLNVSPKLVQAWEGNRRQPTGPALVLLRLIEKEPALVDTIFQYKVIKRGSKAGAERRRKAGLMRLAKRKG